LLRPDDFIPLAERTGLISDLTRVVLERSIEACGRWRADGRPLGVAVNLSARGILDPGLTDTVTALLERHGVPAACLTLEITESSVVGSPTRALQVLNRLREIEVALALDDFGTGYSSLSYLRELPVQSLKIDKRFVSRLCEGGEDAAIVRSIVGLARNLGLRVVAEGVEDDATWALLDELDCDLVQGYRLARPMPLDAFPGWMAAAPRRRRIDLVRGERGVRPGQPLGEG
jgi:EAL domain-containing protein (putative c-di-GMP-specific phosphodiesterase class I)